MKEEDYNKRYKYLIPPRMAAYRKNKNISQKEMAKRLDVSATYISNIECGVNKIPLWVVEQYCEVLEIPPEVMLRLDNDDITGKTSATHKEWKKDLPIQVSEIVRKLPEPYQKMIYSLAESLLNNLKPFK